MSLKQNESVKLSDKASCDRASYDSPWKKALEVYFKEFVQFFFPDIAAKAISQHVSFYRCCRCAFSGQSTIDVAYVDCPENAHMQCL